MTTSPVRGIALSGVEVRGILNGRVSQIGRIVTPKPDHLQEHTWKGRKVYSGEHRVWCWREHAFLDAMVDCHGTDTLGPAMAEHCPLAKRGERLFVKETWVKLIAVSPLTGEPFEVTAGERLIEPPTSYVDGRGKTRWNYDGTVIAYRANSAVVFCDGDGFSGDRANRSDMPRWRSPATMTRDLSRIVLEVVSVRCHRVQDTTEADAAAEGEDGEPYVIRASSAPTYRERYEGWWDERHKHLGIAARWARNPWKWALTIKRVS